MPLKQINVLAPQLRARRLDMFAAGIQDWIGHPAADLFERDRENNRFRGEARIEPIPYDSNQDNAVRVVGRVYPGKRTVPSTMVILDDQGIVVGIARSFATSNSLNSWLFGNRLSRAPLRGYIRDYDPAKHYTIRSANNDRLSDQAIQISQSSERKQK